MTENGLMDGTRTEKLFYNDSHLSKFTAMVLEYPAEEAPRVEALLQEEMQGVAQLSVPLPADAHSGPDWLSAKG